MLLSMNSRMSSRLLLSFNPEQVGDLLPDLFLFSGALTKVDAQQLKNVSDVYLLLSCKSG
jgi:hypothetical protein